MSLKIAFLLFACCTLAMGFSIEPRAKRQAEDQGISAQTSNDDASNSDSDSDLRNTFENNIVNPLRGLGNRFRNAVGKTYQEEKDSVSDSFNNVKDLMAQRIQTGANLTKTAFDLGTVIPKFGKNLILSDNNQ